MRIGFCNGCWDGLHAGHLHFLHRAADCCDWLIVAINSDDSIRRLKGPRRPYSDLAARLVALDRTELADAIVPFAGDPAPLLYQIKPDVLIRGSDQSHEGNQFAGTLIRIQRIPCYSTTEKYKHAPR